MIARDSGNHYCSCLPERSSVLCGCAVSTLESISHKIIRGDITIEDLQKIDRRRDNMDKLLDAMTGKECDATKTALIFRLREYRTFTERRELLGNLGKGVSSHINVKGELCMSCVQPRAY